LQSKGCRITVYQTIELEGEAFFETDVSAEFFGEGDETCSVTGYRIDRIEVDGQESNSFDGMVQVYPFGKVTIAT
jgi:hypothetical protein